MKFFDGHRVPEAGEHWIYYRCEQHRMLPDLVLIGRSFDDQPEFLQNHILSRVIHGCFVASPMPNCGGE